MSTSFGRKLGWCWRVLWGELVKELANAKANGEKFAVRQRAVLLGALPRAVALKLAELTKNKDIGAGLWAKDDALYHTLRTEKEGRGQSVGAEFLQGLPDALADAKWYFDPKEQNLILVFRGESAETVRKVVFHAAFAQNKGKSEGARFRNFSASWLATAGLADASEIASDIRGKVILALSP